MSENNPVTPEELAAFLDDRLVEKRKKEVLEQLSRDNALLTQLVRTGQAVIRKHDDLPPDELERIKGIVKPAFPTKKVVLAGLGALAAALVIILATSLPGDGGVGEEKPYHKTGGSRVLKGTRKNTGGPSKRTSRNGRTRPRNERTRPDGTSKPDRKDPYAEVMQRVPARYKKEVRKLIPETGEAVDEIFKDLCEAISSEDRDRAEMMTHALAAGGALSMTRLEKVLLDNYGESEKLCVLDALVMMHDWKILTAEQKRELYLVLKNTATSGGNPGARIMAMRKLAKYAPTEEALPVLKSLIHDEMREVKAVAIELFTKSASSEEVVREMIRILDDDPSAEIKTLAVERLRKSGVSDRDVFDKVRENLSASSNSLRLASAKYLLSEISSLPTEMDKESVRTEVFSTLRQVALAASPGDGENEGTALSKQVTSMPVSPSEKAALEAIKLYEGGSMKSLKTFLAPLTSSSSGAVRKYVLIEMIKEKDLDGVPLASAELKTVEEKETVFRGALLNALKSSFGMPGRIETESKNRTPSETADLIDEWWNEVREDIEQRQREREEEEEEKGE